ncbi:unnamed protein product [Durusdinium trenchii]|uniref:Protein kinase domain-containing protein n=1 Tax=Durusdinium trenchii TaxID=1381693 RepID=A0ABP0S977_9DINO
MPPEPWRQQLTNGSQPWIWSTSGGCWARGTIVDTSAERLKVEYVVNGELIDKTVLRESPHLRQGTEPRVPELGCEEQAATSPQGTPFARPLRPELPGLQPVPVVAAQPALIRAPVQLPQPPVGALPAIRLADVHFGPVLGSGGFGSVHRGHLRGYPNEVAIKKLHLMGPLSQEHLKEFYKEAANLQALRHERLIQLIGIACEMPLLCIVTELAAGGSLHDLLHVKRLQLQEAQKHRLILQMTEGVMFLHGQRPPFVHRDLKSANVVLDLELNAKLCDLGITECMERTHISRKDAEAGSPRYMSPELFCRSGKLTEKMDIWALGCLAMEVITGRVPHEECMNVQQAFRRYCINANIALVRPEFLEELCNDERVWPHRQEAEAIPGALYKPRPDEKFFFIGISHCWESREHPDPFGFQLRTVVEALNYWREVATKLLVKMEGPFMGDWAAALQKEADSLVAAEP